MEASPTTPAASTLAELGVVRAMVAEAVAPEPPSAPTRPLTAVTRTTIARLVHRKRRTDGNRAGDPASGTCDMASPRCLSVQLSRRATAPLTTRPNAGLAGNRHVSRYARCSARGGRFTDSPGP